MQNSIHVFATHLEIDLFHSSIGNLTHMYEYINYIECEIYGENWASQTYSLQMLNSFIKIKC